MPRPAATPAQRERQRARLRRAAAEVYAEKGAHGVTARAIAQRAGVAPGTLYSYFAGLSELMRSLWMEPVAEANRDLEAIARAETDPVERIRALLQAFADFARANPDVYRGAFLYVRPASMPEPEVEPLEGLVFYRLLCAAIREGQLAGQIVAGDVEELAQILWSGLHGAMALPVNAEAFALRPAERLAPAMIRTLLRAISTDG